MQTKSLRSELLGTTLFILLWTVLPIALLPRWTESASASEGVWPIEVGTTPTLELAEGYGINISFLPLDEIINQVWLDDPSWIVIDANGCLAGLGADRDCQERPAQILHLRRIEPLTLPGLPTSPDAQLTVVTQTATGTENIYVFRIARGGDQRPHYHTVEVVPVANETFATVDLTAVQLGRDWAIEQGWLEPGDMLHQRIERFLDLANTQSAPSAAKTAGISLELVTRLEQLGLASLPPDASNPSPGAFPELHQGNGGNPDAPEPNSMELTPQEL
ncbi:MAG: hypothetical protein AAFQ89_10420 [Cyanobacteria bacterium J06626_18]